VEDDSLLSTPPPFFPDIFGDYDIPDFACVSPSMDAPIVEFLQNTPDVSPSSYNGEDQSFLENPLDFSSAFSKNAEGEHSCISSTPLCDSSNHEDVEKHLEFFDIGFRDLSTSSSDQNVDSIIVSMSKTLVCDDLSINEVETLYTIKEV